MTAPCSGSAADDAQLCGNPCPRGQGAHERKSGSDPVVAIASNRFVQPVVVALDRRSAALFLGTVFPLFRSAAAISPVSAEVHRNILFPHRCSALWAREGL